MEWGPVAWIHYISYNLILAFSDLHFAFQLGQEEIPYQKSAVFKHGVGKEVKIHWDYICLILSAALIIKQTNQDLLFIFIYY